MFCFVKAYMYCCHSCRLSCELDCQNGNIDDGQDGDAGTAQLVSDVILEPSCHVHEQGVSPEETPQQPRYTVSHPFPSFQLCQRITAVTHHEPCRTSCNVLYCRVTIISMAVTVTRLDCMLQATSIHM